MKEDQALFDMPIKIISDMGDEIWVSALDKESAEKHAATQAVAGFCQCRDGSSAD
jgi:hypothetical protein